MSAQNSYDRLTFSLPHEMNLALERLKEELHSSKSEIIKQAIDRYLQHHEELRLKKAVELMHKEYEENEELTYLNALDGEEFL